MTTIRQADPQRDAEACAAIYAHYVRTSYATFEEEPPTADDFARRIAAAHRWLVAERDGAVAGYAYGAPHKERAAYRWAGDVAVYLDVERRGGGLGRALYAELIPWLRDAGLWTLCAGITQPNAASEALHRAYGFHSVGIYRRIGFKSGAWRDVEWWQLDLRPGEPGPPAEPGVRAVAASPEPVPAPSPDRPVRGGCLCGAVRYEVTAPFRRANVCHCSRCRRHSGSIGLVQGRVPRAGFALLGGAEEVRVYRPPDGGMAKAFCGRCGSSLFGGTWPDGPEVSIRFGTLDDDPGIRPQYHAFSGDVPAWDRLPDDGLPRHEQGAPAP